MTGTLTQID